MHLCKKTKTFHLIRDTQIYYLCLTNGQYSKTTLRKTTIMMRMLRLEPNHILPNLKIIIF